MDERGHRVVRVESTRAGEDPDGGVFEGLGLPAERRLGATKGVPEGADAEEGDDARPVTAHLESKALAPGDELGLNYRVDV